MTQTALSNQQWTLNIRVSFLLAVLLLLAAAGFRMWQLSTLPAGLTEDEITDIQITEVLRGGLVQAFYNINGETREGLYHLLLAVNKAVFGGGILIYRMLSLWAGLLTLAIIYAVTVRLYGPIAAVAAMALLTFGMFPIILSRTVGRESLVILLVAAVLLALATSLPVYLERFNREGSTTAFAMLGALLGFGFYIHPFGLITVLFSMLFIAYLVLSRQPINERRRNYTSFAILLMIIIAMPYFIASLRLPELSGASRLIGHYEGVLRSIGTGLAGLVFIGDANAARNLPGRPMIDLVSGLLVILGGMAAIRNHRQPRFVLPLIASITLIPGTFLTTNTPNFLAYAALLPVLALFFGIGVHILLKNVQNGRTLALAGLLGLLVFNIFWTGRDLFTVWQQPSQITRAGKLAHHLDLTASEIPSVICGETLEKVNFSARLNNAAVLSSRLSKAQIIALMMNNQSAPVRYAICESGLVLTNGGERQQVILSETNTLQDMHPYLRGWLAQGTPVQKDSLPSDSVIELAVVNLLADTTGRFTTTAPVAYAPEVAHAQEGPLAPPVSFGGNITFLGYEKETPDVYPPGGILTLISYWRIDGMLPSDLILFTHVLSDPGALPAAQTDTISTSARKLQNRDIFIQVTSVQFPQAIPDGVYFISIGAYQNKDKQRMDVLENGIAKGNRLFLYPISILRNDS